MKGGYQIINLSGTTAGDPVTVPGIYNMAKENNEKAVMLYTPDSQRVFSQIKKVDGVYKTTYLSAEGNVVTVEIASNDAVTTTITNPTSSIVGLEVAVNDLSETKANRADVAAISIDGNYNNTGETIPAGTVLYLNNELIKTTAEVLDEGEFIESGEGANYTVDTVEGELAQLNINANAINNQLQNITCVLIDNFTAQDNFFTRLCTEMIQCRNPEKAIPSIPNNSCFGRVFAVRGTVTLGSTDFAYPTGVLVVNADRASGYIVDYQSRHYAAIHCKYSSGDQSGYHIIY